jgi:hypothetical protein
MHAAVVPHVRVALVACAFGVCLGLATADPLPGNLPLRRDPPPALEGGGWMPSLLLLGVAAAAGGYGWWRRGSGRQAAARRGEAAVTRLASQALTPHASVHAVQWQGEEFLLACTPQQVTLLARRPIAAGEGEAS